MKKQWMLVALLLSVTPTAHGETLVALTTANDLIQFDSASPGTTTSIPVTGLIVGDALSGIDVRPTDGRLYGFATDSGPGGADLGVGKIYSIDTTSGLATLAATLAADPADLTDPTPFDSISGAFFGVDFNPVVDRLRVVSDTGQNLRVNVTNGLTQLDVPLAYGAADPQFGTPPLVVASAYTNSVPGAGSTTLYNIDAFLGNLVTQLPPNDGTLNSVGLVAQSTSTNAAFDISGLTGNAYTVLDGATLSSINLTNGAVTGFGAVDAPDTIIGLAVLAVPIPEPATILLMSVASFLLPWRLRSFS